jgi:predicted ATP-grasp superfamily ATP-dependent carboligase
VTSNGTAVRPPVVLLGGIENSISVARSLGRRGVEVHGLGEPGSIVRHSRYCRSYRGFTGDLVAGWLGWLLSEAPKGMLVLPCCDEGMELVAKHRAALAERGLVAIEADDKALLDALDKQRTYELARAAGIGAPRTAVLSGWDDLERAYEEIGVPCALKPVHIHEYRRHFRGKVVVIDDLASLREAFRRPHELGLDMILTEIIPGSEDRYCSYFTYLVEDGKPLFHFTKRKLRQYPVGFGGGTYHLTEWADDVAEAGLGVLRALGVRGLGNVEFKRDPRDGRLKVIECNARFTAGNEIVRLAGVDIAELVYARMTGQPLPQIGRGRDGVRMLYPAKDTLAFLQARRNGQLTTAAWLRSLLHPQTFPVWTLRDPLPSLAEATSVPRRALRKARSRRAVAMVRDQAAAL